MALQIWTTPAGLATHTKANNVILGALVAVQATALCQPACYGQSTVVPTDTLALPGRHKGPDYLKPNYHEFKLLNKLPAKLYINFFNESSFRYE